MGGNISSPVQGFKEYKERKIQALKEALNAGRVDEPIVDFLLRINEAEGFATSSSCAGRVQLIRMHKRKDKSVRYYIEHVPEKITSEELSKALERAIKEGKEKLYLKVEPFIYHFAVESEELAEKVVECCRLSGVKRCGYQRIRHAYLLETMGTISVSIPLSVAKVEVDSFISLAKDLLRENEKRRKKLEKCLIETFLNTTHN